MALMLEALRGASKGGPDKGCTCVATVGPGSVGMNTSMSLCFPGGGSTPASSMRLRLPGGLQDLQQSLL